MLGQRRRRWADVVQMLYTCFVFVGMLLIHYTFASECHELENIEGANNFECTSSFHLGSNCTVKDEFNLRKAKIFCNWNSTSKEAYWQWPVFGKPSYIKGRFLFLCW